MTWSRSVLGALDNNLSGGNKIARRKDGQERFKTQVSVLISLPFNFFLSSSTIVSQKGRSSSRWVARPIYEAKDYSWKFELKAKVE